MLVEAEMGVDEGTVGMAVGSGGVGTVELVGALNSEPGPELAGVRFDGKIAAPSKRREFNIISSVVRKFTNGCV